MTDTLKLIQKRVQRPGFTLVELLVAIGLIVLLLAVLLPTVSRVRVQAQAAKTQSIISSMGSAMERYHADFRAYPGVFSNGQIASGTTGLANPSLTQTENGIAALLGGIEPDGPPPSIVPKYVADSIGKGPMSFSPSIVNRKRTPAYIDAAPGTLLPELPYSTHGIAANAEEVPGTPPSVADSEFPEFYDGYSQARPIIYLRANLGAPGIASGMGTANPPTVEQYNTYDFTRYQRGASDNFIGDFQFSSTDSNLYADIDKYLEQQNGVNTPKGKDKFVLISAGADRAFGTRDDHFYGGSR